MKTLASSGLCFCLLAAACCATASISIRVNAAAVNPVPQLETRDTVNTRAGVFRGGSGFSANGEGRSGQTGDYAAEFPRTVTGPLYVGDASFLNPAAANDQLSVAFWTKKYDTADGSAFWANSPSSTSTSRGYQAHVPWSDGTIYFDSSGCCDTGQRLSANIDTFPNYTGDMSWWTNEWHHFIFLKNGGTKQIWIDGILFLEGADSAPLPTDFTDLFIGSDGTGGGVFHALMDDFAVFSTALTEADAQALAGGTLPSALPASKGLIAYWNFNDYPPEGQFITVTPEPNTAGGSPNIIQVVHADGVSPWQQSNVSLKLDGNDVPVTFTKEGNIATVTYISPTLLPIQSEHTATLTYPGADGQPRTLEWVFTVGPYTTDSVESRIGILTGGSSYTADAGGRTGTAGDYAIDFGRGGTGPVQVMDAAFLNEATANDEMTFAAWVKKYDIADSSLFWAVSPSTAGQRGFQVHVPWSNNNIYFDTAGCCDGTQRINASVEDFPGYTGDISWWTNEWHFFVFSKKADVKQIWIDGQLFLEGSNTGVLPTDFTRLVIGGDSGTGNRIHGIVDDVSIFSKQLAETEINQLFTGTKPDALPASTGLMAYWDFNDIPAQGIFLSYAPAPDSTNAAPNHVSVVHLQGTTAWDLSKVSLSVDGAPVGASVTKEGQRVTVSYKPAQLFAIGSTHTAVITYPGLGGDLETREWEFTVAPYTVDTVRQNPGSLLGATKFTPDAGGHSGAAGDYAMDFGTSQAGQGVRISDASFMNEAATNDQVAVVGWQKLHSLANSAFFWATSPGSNGGQRGFGAFPWSNENIYFDTAGCCDAATQRINEHINIFPGYTGDATWWQEWHHFVYQKNASTKEIWIDGQLFLQGDNTNPLPTDFTEAYIGFDVPDNARLQGIVDDFAVFGTALSESIIGQLASGTLPSALPASANLLVYWNFNDASSGPGPRPELSVARGAGKITLTYTGVLESAVTINGTWTPVPAATSPFDVNTTEPQRYYRAAD